MENKKIKTGEIRVTIEKEEPIWCDRKRILFCGLPWSFTKYTLTPSRLFIKRGWLSVKEEEVRLYRIVDVSYSQTFSEKLCGVGTLTLSSSDTTCPTVELKHIKRSKLVKDIISQTVETARRENGVRTSEMVGMHHPNDGHNHQSFGPQIAPDMDHNGIDDRLE